LFSIGVLGIFGMWQ